MSLTDFLSAAWADHASNCEGVATRLPGALTLAKSAEDIAPFVNLTVHVLGDHLGRWDDGLELLSQVAATNFCEGDGDSGHAVQRGQAVLLLCKGDRTKAEELAIRAHAGPSPRASTFIRILAGAAAALAQQKRIPEATSLFEEALGLTSYGPTRGDPAARALAVTANNLASDLEGKADKLAVEIKLMKIAAATARQYWEVCGGWLEVERAEYRLAMTLLAANEPAAGLEHAELCLSMCRTNNAGLFELFFGHEARAKCLLAMGRKNDAASARTSASQVVDSMSQSLKYLTEQLKNLDDLFGKNSL